MQDHVSWSPDERPTAEQVEFYAREQRARAWSLHVFSPLHRFMQRMTARLVSRANRTRTAGDDRMPAASTQT